MRRSAYLGISVATAVLASSGLAARPVSADSYPHVTANVDITELNKSPVRDDAIPGVAVDPNDSRHIAVVEGDFRTGTCLLHVSTDGGATFATAKRSPLPPQFEHCTTNAGTNDFPMAWGQDGSLIVAIHAFNGTTNVFDGPVNVVVSRTTNNGDDWQSVVAERNGPNATGVPSGGLAAPTLQPGEVSTSSTATSSGAAATSTSTSAGATASGSSTASAATTSSSSSSAGTAAPTPAPPPSHGVFGIFLASDHKGRVYVTWQQRSVKIPSIGANENRAFVAASTDDGKSFGAAVDVAGTTSDSLPDRRGPAMTIAPDGTVFTLFKESKPPKKAPPSSLTPSLVVFKSTDHGATWTRSVVAPNTDFTDYPVITAAPTNGGGYALVAAWEDLADGSAGQQQVRDIFVSRSTDAGATWSPRKRVTDDPPTSFANKFVPGISAAPNGRIDLAWVDFRNDDGHLLSDVYATSSSDGGATWTANLRVTDHSSNRHYGQFANYSDVRGPVGVASDNYAAYFAWDDNRNASDAKPVQDVYFAAVQLAPLPTSSGYTTLRVLGAIIGGLLAGGLALLLVGIVLRMRRGGARRADTGTATT